MDSSSLGVPGAATNDSIHGLKFGKKIYFEDGSIGGGGSSMQPPPPAVPAHAPVVKKGKGAAQGGGGQQPPRCQVEGCKVDLTGAKTYYCRHKVCGMHSKAPKVIVGGLQQRFCQQCSRFHQLPEFDQGKRSCRRRLAGHNERRRKPPPGPFSARYGRLATSFHEESSRFRSFLMDFSYPRLTSNGGRDLWPATRSGDHVPDNQWQGVLDPSSAAADSHPYMQGPPGVGLYSASASQVPPGECLTGVSDSSCALSLLSTQPWGNSARNRAPPISASSSFDGTPMTQPSVPNSNYIANSWGFRAHGGSANLNEIQPEIGLVGVPDASAAHFSGELELALQRNGQCLTHDSGLAYDHSAPRMDWSL